jgi:hypothetical protein
MALSGLSERQQIAKRLTDELGKFDGVWVTSPLPLDDNQKLRLQIKDIDRNEVLQLLRDWGWDPICVSVLPRVCSTGLMAACLYEIDLPKPRQDIVDDRAIPKDDIGRRGRDAEAKKTLESIYGKQRW